MKLAPQNHFRRLAASSFALPLALYPTNSPLRNSFTSQLPLSPFPPISCRLLKSLASLFRTLILCFQCFAASFSKTPGGWGIKPPASSFELPEPRIKMTHKSPSSDFTPERCQHRTPTGRQCCSLVVDPNSSFCEPFPRSPLRTSGPRPHF